MTLVPSDFDPPTELDTASFRLRPLGPEDNASDHEAWTTSMEHIHGTPGFEGHRWPYPKTLEENRADLEGHAEDFRTRRGFTFTVLAPGEDVVLGCVYIYPSEDPAYDVSVRSWVRATHSEFDAVLYRAVKEWLESAWPFRRVDYAPRP